MSDIEGSAIFSDETPPMYRHVLSRWWGNGPRVLICGANPSYAGADKNDPTLHSIIRLVRPLPNCGGFDLVNYEPIISTDPNGMRAWQAGMARIDPEGLATVRWRNLQRIRELSNVATLRIIAWGDLVPWPNSHTMNVLAAMSLDCEHPLYAFGFTKGGNPKHPLARGKSRIADGTKPVIWRQATARAAA